MSELTLSIAHSGPKGLRCLLSILRVDSGHPCFGMRPNKVEGLTRKIKPNSIHEIGRPIRPERPGGYRKMLQKPSLKSQLFVGFGKLPCSFRDAPLYFICNPLLLTQAQFLLEPDFQLIRSSSRFQMHVLFLDAIIRAPVPGFIVLTMEGIPHRTLTFGLPVGNHLVKFR